MAIKNHLFHRHLDEGEKILKIAHKSLITLKLKAVKPVFLGLIIPVILYLLIPKLFPFLTIWVIIGFFTLIYHVIDWYFDVWILTNIGVIDIEYNGLFNMTSTRIDYHQIEGIAYSINGFFQTIFNFGDITIDKMGSQTSLILKEASRPKRLERTLMKLQEEYVFERSVQDHNALKNMLSDMIAYHIKNEKIDHPKNNRRKQ
ncbi:hypothetical protein CVV38_03230 [Candidatus Peregrinibacteria bacterium HGW-Peregrinibacteria-1]|jgi:hypothetical protein|nr:MAG: hypothetical protein CVV38_03230 [Candidatus Peregrinibacteria bacterium HGW-Peregrinibacteria-1]